MCSVESKPLFRDLTAEDPEPEVTEIESLCMNCHKNGKTRLLLTRIPYYKNVVLMSFSCEECGFANNEIQPGGAYADMGVRWKLRVESQVDLDRQIVKSDYTSVRIPELDFEIPAQSQKGEVTTIEGVLSRAITGLAQQQSQRAVEHPETAAQIQRFIEKLQALVQLKSPFTVEVEDISGNCFIENPDIPRKDPRCERTEFTRTTEQDHALGIFTHEEVSPDPQLLQKCDPAVHSYDRLEADEVITFRTNCPECNAPADTNMKLTNIPHFKEVVIMATTCDVCGHRTNEVKSGGGIEEKGVKFEIQVKSRDDFSRDILKSETCSVTVPELSWWAGSHALGGRFTTVEGLLQAARDQLAEAPAVLGDSAQGNDNMLQFLSKLDKVLSGEMAITIILDDPAGNSYVQSLSDDDKPDERLKITHYERTFEQNEELGLNDMKTDGYENAS